MPRFLAFLISLVVSISLLQAGDPKTVSDLEFSSPDDVLLVVETALNENQPLKIASYFPAAGTTTFDDMALRLNSVSIRGNLPYFPGFEDLVAYHDVSVASAFYTQVKLRLLSKAMPEIAEAIPVATVQEAEAVKEKIKKGVEQRVKITLQKRLKTTNPSLYQYSEAYLYTCTIFVGDAALTDTCSFNVMKIQGRWKLTGASW